MGRRTSKDDVASHNSVARGSAAVAIINAHRSLLSRPLLRLLLKASCTKAGGHLRLRLCHLPRSFRRWRGEVAPILIPRKAGLCRRRRLRPWHLMWLVFYRSMQPVITHDSSARRDMSGPRQCTMMRYWFIGLPRVEPLNRVLRQQRLVLHRDEGLRSRQEA